MGLTLLSEGLADFWLCESLDSLLPTLEVKEGLPYHRYTCSIYEYSMCACTLMHLSAAIPGGDPGDIQGNSSGFAEFCGQFLAQDGVLDCFCTSEARYKGKDLRDL